MFKLKLEYTTFTVCGLTKPVIEQIIFDTRVKRACFILRLLLYLEVHSGWLWYIYYSKECILYITVKPV
jgi:hypothetical protein